MKQQKKRPSASSGSGKRPAQNASTQARQRRPQTGAASRTQAPRSASSRTSQNGSRAKGSGTRPQQSNSRASASQHSARRPAANNARSTQQRARTSPQGGKRPPQQQGARRSTPQRRRKPKRRLRWGRILAVLLVLVACVALAVTVKNQFFATQETNATVAQSVSTPLVSDTDKAGFDASINSDSAILINADNGDVLYEKDADAQRAPASLAKMMTVYVAIKNNDDLDREIKMPAEAFEGLEEESASQSGLQKGETVTIRDLLYAALLKSGGDAANALALATSGNIESFVELMNEEAKALGLDSTTFVNPTGLDDDAQVSTCRDMARLLKGALGSTVFEEVFTSRTYTTTANDTHKDGLTLTHTMDEDLANFQRYFDTSGYEIVGGKTGYTAAAGNCLASLAEKEGKPNYIVVTMHATGNGDQYYQAVHDAVTLYGEAYDQ
ncbi:MAG: serine hydrolase [Peptococcaceae bacterium]|nr:serine hydrolase [Peptococcaceae bacterium]